jgi:hypothetical protein
LKELADQLPTIHQATLGVSQGLSANDIRNELMKQQLGGNQILKKVLAEQNED